eukprot:COSAG02_NODE_28892_length_580_cov_0.837838_1_plen_69_part_01
MPREVGVQELDAFELAFSGMESNDDGLLSAYDFAASCLAIRDEPVQPDQTLMIAEATFRTYDQDQSGYL